MESYDNINNNAISRKVSFILRFHISFMTLIYILGDSIYPGHFPFLSGNAMAVPASVLVGSCHNNINHSLTFNRLSKNFDPLPLFPCRNYRLNIFRHDI